MLTQEQKKQLFQNMGVNEPTTPSWEDDWKKAAGLKTNGDMVSSIEKTNPPVLKKGFLERFGDVSGKVLEGASDFAFGTTKKTVGGLITQGIGAGMEVAGDITKNPELTQKGTKLIESSGFGMKPGEEGQAPSVGDIAFTALELYPGGGLVSKYLKKIPGAGKFADVFSKVIPENLKESAIKAYAQVLAPTTKEMKYLTEKVAPQLMEKEVKAVTRRGLEKKIEVNLAEAGNKIDDVLDQIPEGTQLKTQPILDALESSKSDFMIEEGGKKIAAEPEKIVNIDNLKNIIQEFGDKISFNSLRKLRQIWDTSIASGKGFMGKTLTEGGVLDAKKTATSAIRGELAKEFPDLDKVNAEYTLWKNTSDILEATSKRLVGREKPLTQKLIKGTGLAVGFVKGGPVGAMVTGEIAEKASQLFSSPAWKTISAVNKKKLADYLANGDIKNATLYIGKLISMAKNVITTE